MKHKHNQISCVPCQTPTLNYIIFFQIIIDVDVLVSVLCPISICVFILHKSEYILIFKIEKNVNYVCLTRDPC
jgi:hypothetical protein